MIEAFKQNYQFLHPQDANFINLEGFIKMEGAIEYHKNDFENNNFGLPSYISDDLPYTLCMHV